MANRPASGYIPGCNHSTVRVSDPSSGRILPVIDEQHVALPKLYGAPSYGRPSKSVVTTQRPLDPDDLPITVLQTEEERELIEALPGRPYAPGGGAYIDGADVPRAFEGPRARPLSLRAIAGRLLGG